MPTRKDETRIRAKKIARALAREYPDAKCALDYESPFQLLIATILSAQCTDARVNQVTPGLFKKYPSPRDFAEADLAELEEAIRSTGFYRNKAKNIQACSQALLEEHSGEVPGTLEELTSLPGVGRKTANVILGNCFGIPGIVVDTHFGRLSRRMGLTRATDPVKVEKEVGPLIPKEEQILFCHRMILHGRQVCTARKPKCALCAIEKICPRKGV